MGQGYAGKPVFASTFTYAWTKLFGADFVEEALGVKSRDDDARDYGDYPAARIARELSRRDGGALLYSDGSTLITKARCQAAGMFLQSPCDVWLSFDDDAYAPPETVEALIEAAHETRTLVAAPCFARVGDMGDFAARAGTFLNWRHGRWDRDAVLVTPAGHSLFPVFTTSFSLVALHRELVQALASQVPWVASTRGPPFPSLFLESIVGDQWIGEDVGFCLRMLEREKPCWALLNRTATHAGRECMVNEYGDVKTDDETARLLAREAPTGKALSRLPPTR
jgi:hypothetical protein